MFSAVGMDKTQNVPQDFSYLAFCRNGVETRCTFCVTLYNIPSLGGQTNLCLCVRFFRAYNPLINNGLHIFGAHTCILCVLSVEKCVFVLQQVSTSTVLAYRYVKFVPRIQNYRVKFWKIFLKSNSLHSRHNLKKHFH